MENANEISQTKHKLPFPHPGGWALSPASCEFLIRLISYYKFENILEFGSGYSSSIIAHELEKNDNGFLYSIDNSSYWQVKAKKIAEEHKLAHRIQFYSSKLTLKVYRAYAYIWYDMKKIKNISTLFDLIVIDAPRHEIGREGAIYAVFDMIKDGAILFLDDCKADHMRQTIKRWKERYPKSISVDSYHDIGNGIGIIKKECTIKEEPLMISKHLITGWIRGIRNWFRVRTLKLND